MGLPGGGEGDGACVNRKRDRLAIRRSEVCDEGDGESCKNEGDHTLWGLTEMVWRRLRLGAVDIDIGGGEARRTGGQICCVICGSGDRGKQRGMKNMRGGGASFKDGPASRFCTCTRMT